MLKLEGLKQESARRFIKFLEMARDGNTEKACEVLETLPDDQLGILESVFRYLKKQLH